MSAKSQFLFMIDICKRLKFHVHESEGRHAYQENNIKKPEGSGFGMDYRYLSNRPPADKPEQYGYYSDDQKDVDQATYTIYKKTKNPPYQ